MSIANKRCLCKKSRDLRLHPRENGGIRIFDLRGPLIIGNSEALLRTTISGLSETGAVRIVLNLAGVTEIDEDGLGALVFCYALVLSTGGMLKLLHASPLRLGPMVATKLSTVFEVFTDEQDAINSFFPDRAVRRYDILEWLQEQKTGATREW
jgi:anti-sigma B factor antagonist